MLFMKKELKPESAAKAIGPYSLDIETDDYVFISGQIGMDPTTWKLVSNDIEQQTTQTMKNIQIILK